MIKLISKHRSALMGFAIIWVMLFHFLSDQYFFGEAPVKYFSSIGYGGVDIFFMLSGLGLVFGYDKYKNPLQFYIRRLIRIYPTYLVVLLINMFLINKEPLIDVLIASTGVGFFLPFWKVRWFEWYVPSLLLFYLMFPLIIYSVRRFGKKTLVLWAIAGYLCTAALVYIQKGTVILATSRFPIFILGVYFGLLMREGKDLSSNSWWTIPLSFFFLIVEIILVQKLDHVLLWRSSLYWTPFIFVVPGLCYALSLLLDKKLRTLEVLLHPVGKRSLELYLIHISFGGYFIKPIRDIANSGGLTINVWSSLLVFIVFFLCSLISAFLLSVITSKIDNQFTNLLRIKKQ